MQSWTRAAVAVSLLSGTTGASAQFTPVMVNPSDKADSVDKKTGKDPNEVVCEYEEELGSRLKGHKVCATRAEWADRRLETRKEIDAQQRNQPTHGG